MTDALISDAIRTPIGRYGGVIALGHPWGMSGAGIALTATEEFTRGRGRDALRTMCVALGQGIALRLEAP
jgi:acetyl-CoA acetyltransferase